jgi:hypothetical protein
MLRRYNPSNQHCLYSWRHSLILAMCGHWLEVPKDCEAFFGGARLKLPRNSIFRTFWEPHDIQVWRAKDERRLPRRWAVAKTLKMCWPEWNTHFTSGIHSFEPISITCQHSGDDLSSRAARLPNWFTVHVCQPLTSLVKWSSSAGGERISSDTFANFDDDQITLTKRLTKCYQ